VHNPPLGPVKPLLHIQPLAALLPEEEVELGGQSIQAFNVAAPVAVEYVPPTQLVQAADPDNDLYFPAEQLTHSQLFVYQSATNPDIVPLLSEANTTCRYPVDDVYALLELNAEPESWATCSTVLHDDVWQRFTYM